MRRQGSIEYSQPHTIVTFLWLLEVQATGCHQFQNRYLEKNEGSDLMGSVAATLMQAYTYICSVKVCEYTK